MILFIGKVLFFTLVKKKQHFFYGRFTDGVVKVIKCVARMKARNTGPYI